MRPHLLPYDALGVSGERLKYIAKLSKETGLSDNSLRRYIAAAQFLEAEGITEIPPGKRLPVAAVERIARIADLRPGVQQRLIHEVLGGHTSVASLASMLGEAKKRAAKAQRELLSKPVSSPEGFADLANAAKAELATGNSFVEVIASHHEYQKIEWHLFFMEFYSFDGWKEVPAPKSKVPLITPGTKYTERRVATSRGKFWLNKQGRWKIVAVPKPTSPAAQLVATTVTNECPGARFNIQ